MRDNTGVDLSSLKLLVDIIDAGSLSSAARRVGTTRSNISRGLKSLERSVGLQLLRRTTRRIEPTEVGLALYEHGARIVREMEAASAVIATLGQSMTGHVRISVPTGLGHLVLSDLLSEFARTYPDISMKVVFSNRVRDLVASEVDLALQITSTPPESYVARELATIDWLLCMSQDYAARHGLPQTPDELAQHAFISTPMRGSRLPVRLSRDNKQREISLPARIQAENFLFLKHAVLAGLGLGLLPFYAVRDEVEQGRLIHILPDYEVDAWGNRLFLITAPNLLPTIAIKTLIAFLQTKIRAAAVGWTIA